MLVSVALQLRKHGLAIGLASAPYEAEFIKSSLPIFWEFVTPCAA